MELTEKYKNYRKSFVNFVNIYNTEKPSVDEQTKKAINDLHNLWKSISMKSTASEFFAMKEYHTVINTEFVLTDNIVNKAWNDYITNGMEFRVRMMAAYDGHS